jgi:hypothetical protein
MRCNELAAYYEKRMITAWVPLALTDAGLLDSILLTACRHLSSNDWQQQQQQFKELSVQYKLECLRSLREAISVKTSFDDATVAKAVMLVYDEVRSKLEHGKLGNFLTHKVGCQRCRHGEAPFGRSCQNGKAQRWTSKSWPRRIHRPFDFQPCLQV